jgi:gliding motility-associated-like protein
MTRELHFVSNGNDNLSEFSPSLYNIELLGTVPEGFSDIKIGFRLFADHLRSDTAYAYITLVGRTSFAGSDGSLITLCPDATPVTLDDLLSMDATDGGSWLPGTASDGIFNPAIDLPGTYQYIVQDPYCDPDTATFGFEVFDIENSLLGPDRNLCFGDSLTISIPNAEGSLIEWSTGETGSAIRVNEPKVVYVDVLDENGCHFSDTLTISTDIDCIATKLFVPNIFSPDNNGYNDVFLIQPLSQIGNFDFTVFDRWGNAVYQQEGDQISWDGMTGSGKPVNPGVYVYKLFIEIDGNMLLRQGEITLIR